MGGTTAKVCFLDGGYPTIVNTLEVARAQRFIRGSGMPLLIPSVELIEIGAGGGSIARVDAMGLLQVGPESAGAQPGPAGYGFGATEPTVTDANLLLGYLDAGYFLGGQMRLDVGAAKSALAHLGEAAGMSPLEAAWEVHQVVNENMAQAARIHLQEKNRDPRTVTLIAFGGAGPTHAAAIRKLLEIRKIVFSLGAGATSALGCVASPLAFHFTRTLQMPSTGRHLARGCWTRPPPPRPACRTWPTGPDSTWSTSPARWPRSGAKGWPVCRFLPHRGRTTARVARTLSAARLPNTNPCSRPPA